MSQCPISSSFPPRSEDEEDLSVAEMTAQLEGDVKTEWETFQGERNMETVNLLAEKYNHRAGKWLLHISSEWVDKVKRRKI